ncbi:MAG: alpha/beta fold hydrolase [Sandaracinus sp.]|nr:alpha/beta fold hydrolase [Sandaracinus sp.]MCB9616037.1 alpha/beta fold hydrolase [Sandaracinus sp.]MCB9632420.1 alpha/beta fold hydrolase [Sandaracinus sp.]
MERPTLGGAQLWIDRRWRDGFRVQRHALFGQHRLLDPRDRVRATGSLAVCERALDRAAPPRHHGHLVVVLHGLGRSRRSMRPMVHGLREEGHSVAWLDYASTRRTLDEHANDVADLIAHVDADRVSFVTHSLGGLVARATLPRVTTAHRLVMCAPPSRGAALARLLHRRARPVAGRVFGPVLDELAAGPEVPLPTVPFLVIAGAKGERINPLLQGPDDGIVTVEETKLEGMREHLVVDAIHTFVMHHPEAIAAARRFLRD